MRAADNAAINDEYCQQQVLPGIGPWMVGPQPLVIADNGISDTLQTIRVADDGVTNDETADDGRWSAQYTACEGRTRFENTLHFHL